MGPFAQLAQLVAADDHVVDLIRTIGNPQRSSVRIHARERCVL